MGGRQVRALCEPPPFFIAPVRRRGGAKTRCCMAPRSAWPSPRPSSNDAPDASRPGGPREMSNEERQAGMALAFAVSAKHLQGRNAERRSTDQAWRGLAPLGRRTQPAMG